MLGTSTFTAVTVPGIVTVGGYGLAGAGAVYTANDIYSNSRGYKKSKSVWELSYEEDDVYLLKSQRGICFELEDIEADWDSITWFKHNAPIEYIQFL